MTDAARPAPQPARAQPDVMRELADRYDVEVPGYPPGVAMIRTETLRAWADHIAELEAACDTTRDQIEREAIDLQREFGPDDEDVQRLFAWSERLQAALNR
jgi:hypothetical protein